MAVQIPDPGTGNGQTGDNEYVFRKKVKDNFSDATNAASRLVGKGLYQVPDGANVFASYEANKPAYILNASSSGVNCDDFEVSTINFVEEGGNIANLPLGFGNPFWLIETHAQSGSANAKYQIARAFNSNIIVYRKQASSGTYLPWTAITETKKTYNTTTAAGANVVVDEYGALSRSTSSERYKDILALLVLDDARYADAMALQPIVYRSTADADNPLHHFYSFSAEELGAYDPAFTLWRTTETVTDAEGITTEQPLAERQAEGININALLAMSHAIAIKQDKIIKALEARIEILEAK